MKQAFTNRWMSRLASPSLAVLGLILGGTVLAGINPVQADGGSADGNGLYQVECEQDANGNLSNCAVDQNTYIGWRTFGGTCAQCHGENATGSSFAPNLIRKLEAGMDGEAFLSVLREGRAGGAMPSFKDNPNVWNHAEKIYAYLRARADGELAPGRPGRIGR